MATKKFLRTILAAIADTGASGQVAARKAIELAWLFDADVVLYHACYDSALSGGVFFDTPGLARARRDLMARATARLESLATSIAEAGIEVHCQVAWQRRVAEAVAQAATRARADLVVAEPRYRGTGRRRGLSHTDWEVARLSPVPVLMCRSAAPYSKPHVIAAVDPGGHELRPSSLDVRIVNLAASMASEANGSVRIVHCLREPPISLAVRPELLRRETQRVRDTDRRRVLEDELRSEEDRLARLKAEFNNGEPERRGDERNFALYAERVQRLREDVARSESNVSALRRELALLRTQ
jgi:universal stress protein E